MTPPLPGLLRHADFRRFWAADTVSQAGAAVTLVALPLVAVGTLGATPFEAGLLVAFEYAAFLLIGLPAGAWVDQVRRRPVMVAADVVRAVLLFSVPAASWLGALTLPQLYAVAFGMSVCTAFFDVAYGSYLPHLVPDEQLVAANIRIEAGRSTVQVGGPGVGGALVGALTAPVALVVDVLSFGLSALLLGRIRRPEARPEGSSGTRSGGALRTEIAEGLRFVLGDRLLRAVTLTAAASNLCGTIGASMLMVLLVGELRLSPFLCGLVFTAEAVGGLIGSLLTARFTARLGQGPAMCAAVAGSAVLWLLAVPFFRADGRFVLAVLLQAAGWVLFMTFRITSVAFRQRLCPKPLLGRTTATVRFLVWGVMPIGALAGGVLGQGLGVRQALWAGALGELLAVLPVLCSPLRRMRELPCAPAEPASRPLTGAATG
ncbi:MFS transporter [Kitasatospora sp. NPDC089913]|uniref:MFS transporter n=1 Tax=Streptomycetaceae TaxID=2062 RepID=UPI000879BBB5|nr:MFS transporter [Streptomyces sp. TLI_053]SDS97546.1 Predicted arabinose efflux permease, MFS family [Streptomyces sp. TLI_053]